jgi:ceramide synthetase
LPIGAAVMILHDLTDLGCSIFKLTIDITPTVVEVTNYFVMVVPWIYVRLWFFPAHVIYRIFEEMNSWDGVHTNNHMNFMLIVFLIFLFLIHIFWFYLMVKGFVRRVKGTWNKGISITTKAN